MHSQTALVPLLLLLLLCSAVHLNRLLIQSEYTVLFSMACEKCIKFNSRSSMLTSTYNKITVAQFRLNWVWVWARVCVHVSDRFWTMLSRFFLSCLPHCVMCALHRFNIWSAVISSFRFLTLLCLYQSHFAASHIQQHRVHITYLISIGLSITIIMPSCFCFKQSIDTSRATTTMHHTDWLMTGDEREYKIAGGGRRNSSSA